ncbi:DUF6221 family protein [Streptomyces sp. NPDC057620]|uniref:DUF6221 family protein n=1 Tax=Streptomyces sp. NPDC057620 TaxID=3346185 RepID=UPI0036C5A0B4
MHDPAKWLDEQLDDEQLTTELAYSSPSQRLHEIDAKREIVRDYRRALTQRDDAEVGTDAYHRSVGAVTSLRRAVCLLAVAYAERPGFKEEWRP